MPDEMLHAWEDGSTSLQSPEKLKNDAIRLGFKPGAKVITVAGLEIGVTSWPYHGEPEPDDPDGPPYRGAYIMARTDIRDPSTNKEMSFYQLMYLCGQFEL